MKQSFKTNALLCAVMLFAVSSFAQTAADFNLKGTIKGVRAGKAFILSTVSADGSSKGIDSAAIKNGVFTLKGKVSAPEMLTLLIKPGNWKAKVFVEHNNMTITADTAGAVHYDYTKYGQDKGAELTRVKVTGSKSQEEYFSYERAPEQLKFKAQFAEISKRLKATKDKEKQRQLRLENSKVAEANKKWQLEWMNNFITTHPSSTAGAYIFANYKKFDYEMPLTDFDTTMKKFSGTAKTSVYFMDMEKELNAKKALLPGNIAPDFTLLQRDKTKRTLSAMRGKYVMIDFWASWCHPCRAAIPHWKEVYAKYHDKGFEILGLSLDANWNEWTKAMDIEQMPWPQVVDDFPVKNAPSVIGTVYQTTFIPFYVLLDPEGKILVYSGDKEAVEAKLAEVLK